MDIMRVKVFEVKEFLAWFNDLCLSAMGLVAWNKNR